MKNKMMVLAGVLVIFLVGTGVVVYNVVFAPKQVQKVAEEPPPEILPSVDASVTVDVTKSKTQNNAVVILVNGLGGKMVSVAYELTYDSQGLIKGVNSGSKPIDVSGKDSFEREIYLGTCSRNVCKPDAGVTKVSVVLQFTDAAGQKSQFIKDYDL